MQASPASRVRLSSDLPDSQPAGMAPSSAGLKSVNRCQSVVVAPQMLKLLQSHIGVPAPQPA